MRAKKVKFHGQVVQHMAEWQTRIVSVVVETTQQLRQFHAGRYGPGWRRSDKDKRAYLFLQSQLDQEFVYDPEALRFQKHFK